MGNGAVTHTEWKVFDPCKGQIIWEAPQAGPAEIEAAVYSARNAQPTWFALGYAAREKILRQFAEQAKSAQEKLAQEISLYTGKPLWEAKQEADLLPAKVEASIAAREERQSEKTLTFEGYQGVLRFKPHGVVAVLGPFNLPAHLPHSHIIPALLAGNCVVFKPSEFAPGVGALVTQLWQAAGLPNGVLNTVQGGRSTGEILAAHSGIDGLFFTGSHRAGVALNKLFADRPGRILALELGGNNPLVVWEPESIQAAIPVIIQSAFLTSGQRCVCARRLIIPKGNPGDILIAELLRWTHSLVVGFPNDKPEPFLGPVIHAAAAQALLNAQKQLVELGGHILKPLEASPRSACLLLPGIIDVTDILALPDEEYFGPLLLVQRVPDFETAIQLANATQFGLAAGLISSQLELWEKFSIHIRAGIVNWNRPITGASGKLPFGGVGESGNHRPSAAFAADYCAFPVASMQSEKLLNSALPMGLINPN